MGSNTSSMNAISETYSVASKWKRLNNTWSPIWPTLYAMAENTAKGANSMIMLVNLNITAVSDSVNLSMGALYDSLTMAVAIPNRILKTTICRTCPSAIDLAIFSGKI